MTETRAKGSRGFIIGSTGHPVFRKFFRDGTFKDYKITHHDCDVVVLSKDAVFREENDSKAITEPAALDYDPDLLGSYLANAKIRPAKGTKVCIMRHRRTLARVYDAEHDFIDYEIRHGHLEVKIIEVHASFWETPGKKYKKYWDGILDYNYKTIHPSHGLPD